MEDSFKLQKQVFAWRNPETRAGYAMEAYRVKRPGLAVLFKAGKNNCRGKTGVEQSGPQAAALVR
jgi:hypothetical protein